MFAILIGFFVTLGCLYVSNLYHWGFIGFCASVVVGIFVAVKAGK